MPKITKTASALKREKEQDEKAQKYLEVMQNICDFATEHGLYYFIKGILYEAYKTKPADSLMLILQHLQKAENNDLYLGKKWELHNTKRENSKLITSLEKQIMELELKLNEYGSESENESESGSYSDFSDPELAAPENVEFSLRKTSTRIFETSDSHTKLERDETIKSPNAGEPEICENTALPQDVENQNLNTSDPFNETLVYDKYECDGNDNIIESIPKPEMERSDEEYMDLEETLEISFGSQSNLDSLIDNEKEKNVSQNAAVDDFGFEPDYEPMSEDIEMVDASDFGLNSHDNASDESKKDEDESVTVSQIKRNMFLVNDLDLDFEPDYEPDDDDL